MNHEEALISAFIDPRRRGRYPDFIAKPRLRRKLLNELGHFKHLDPRYARQRHLGAAGLKLLFEENRFLDVCWVVSENPKIDGRFMQLSDAVSELHRGFGTFLSFVPGKLAYFGNEDGEWIVEHP